jgi:hypothetical protein
MKKLIATILAGIMLTAPTIAFSQQWCNGKLSLFFIQKDGAALVTTSFRGDYMHMCNITTTVNGVAPETCAVWIAHVRNAIERKADTLWYYESKTPCNQLPPYDQTISPFYIMLVN